MLGRQHLMNLRGIPFFDALIQLANCLEMLNFELFFALLLDPIDLDT